MKKIKKGIKQASNSFSFISWECKIFKEIEKETLAKNREKADILIEHLDNWIDTIRPIIKNNPELNRSLIGIRFSETFTDMQLTVFSIFSGCYFQAVRNLRFTFESMIHAFYLESKYEEIYPDLFLELIVQTDDEVDFQKRLEKRLRNEYPQRLDKFRDITGFSATIIDKLPFLPDEKDRLKITYHKLSSMVHPAPEQIKKIIENPDLIFTFSYNEKFFNECVELTDEVMDAAFAIVLYRFPDVKQNIKTKENALLYDSLVRLPITNRLLNN
jgi:hypothetical protein